MARLSRGQSSSPRIAVKRFTGPDHPDRDRRFATTQDRIAIFTESGLPIISVDGKKKDLIGDFRNPGSVWCDEPEEVNGYDFLSDAECRATPYGIYDLLARRGAATSASAFRRTPRPSPPRRSGRGGRATGASATGGRTSC
jgi:hypothetical protein